MCSPAAEDHTSPVNHREPRQSGKLSTSPRTQSASIRRSSSTASVGRMADKDRAKLAADGFAWFGNVSTSVCIIFVNKVLMSSTGYGFRYGEPVFSNPSQVTSCSDRPMMLCRGASGTAGRSRHRNDHRSIRRARPSTAAQLAACTPFSAAFERLLPPLLMSHAETHQRWQDHCLVPSNATGPPSILTSQSCPARPGGVPDPAMTAAAGCQTCQWGCRQLMSPLWVLQRRRRLIAN